jgi:hypothetical protein
VEKDEISVNHVLLLELSEGVGDEEPALGVAAFFESLPFLSAIGAAMALSEGFNDGVLDEEDFEELPLSIVEAESDRVLALGSVSSTSSSFGFECRLVWPVLV